MEKEHDLIRTLNWALMTIRDKLQFGLPEEIAIQRREMRVKGALVDAIEQVEELLEQVEHITDLNKEIEQNYLAEKDKLQKAIEFIKEYQEKYYEHEPKCLGDSYDNRCNCGTGDWEARINSFIKGNHVERDKTETLTIKEALTVTIRLFQEQKLELDDVKAQLKQQQFNNQHNLSIDQTVADRIMELELEIRMLKDKANEQRTK